MKIGVLLGDDIGHEVVPECVKVMKAAASRTGLAVDWQPLPIGKHGHEQHGNTLPACDRGGVVGARRLGHGADRACRLSAQRPNLGHAAGAQEIRTVCGGTAVALLSEHRLDPQGRGHRLRA